MQKGWRPPAEVFGAQKLKLNTASLLLATAVASGLFHSPARAQQTTGVPGSPSATTTLGGEQIPPPVSKFGGEIKDGALRSKPWWAPRVVPPKGAPNVLLIITDDAGFGVPSTFGGVIRDRRVIQAFEDLGKLENTLIIYINGDNGTSAEGGPMGTPNEVAFFNGLNQLPVEVQMKFYDVWGTEHTYNHMSAGWSWMFDAPFSWFKQNASQLGGVNQNMVVSWPARIKDKGGLREQFVHVIDVLPTVLEAAGITAPEVVDGIKQVPMEGTSFAYTFDAQNAKVPSRHATQYFEMMGQWALYHEGWLLSTKVNRAPWEAFGPANPDPLNNQVLELYDLNTDFSQSEDIAAKNPKKVTELKDMFIAEAKKYQVFPMDASVAARIAAPRPNITAGRSEFVYTRPMVGLPQGNSPLLLNTSYTITADIEVPQGGAEGMILTSGGRFAGYGFYLLKGKPVFLWNMVDLERTKWEGAEALTPGRHTVEFNFKYDGVGPGTLAFNSFSGVGQPGTGVLKVDGKVVDTKSMPKTLPMILQWDESFDIGSDTLTGVNDADYKPPFALTAKLNKLTIKLDRPQLSPEDVKKLDAAMRNNKLSE